MQVKMRPATGSVAVSYARAHKFQRRQARLTRVDEREVLDHEAKRIWQEAEGGDQQRPEVQALEAPKCREHKKQQFESIVDRKRASNRDKNRRDIIVAGEESGRVV